MDRQFNLETYRKCMEWIFLTAVVFLTISYFGGYYLIITTIGKHSRLLERTAYVLLTCKVMGTRYNKKEFFILLGMAGLALLTYNRSTNREMLVNVLMIASMKNIDMKKMWKASLFGLMFSVLLVGVCSFLGFGGPVEITQMYGRSDVETRYCFGFIHPNQWAHAAFMLMLFYVLAYWKTLDYKKISVLFLGNLICYYFSVSKTAFLVGMLLVALAVFCRYFPKYLWSGGIIAAEYLITAVVWWISLAAVQQNKAGIFLIEKFNKLFTGRFSNAKNFYRYYGQSLFGMKIEDVHPKTGEVLDMGYIRFLLENGWLWFALMFIAVILLVRFAVKKRRGDVIVAVFCMLLYAFSEAVAFLQVPANVIFYYLGMMLFQTLNIEDDTQTG